MAGMTNFRITTNGMYRNYRNNLYKNNKSLTDSLTTVQTSRKFNTYADDPAAASKAWRLRRSYWRTGDQIDNTNFAISKFESAYTAMGAIVDGDAGNGQYGLNGLLDTIRANTDSAGSGRTTLGMELIETSKNMISVMNVKYGDDFVFAGADGENVPFAWETGADGTAHLFYRGVDVSREEPKMPEEFGFDKDTLDKYGLTSQVLEKDYDPNKTNLEAARLEPPLTKEDFQANGFDANSGDDLDTQYETYKTDYMTRIAGDWPAVENFEEAKSLYKKLSTFQTYATDYATRNSTFTSVSYETGAAEYRQLQKMSNEATYLDIGIGMKESARGEIITGSAYNTAVSGLNFLGYGNDQNLAVIVRELGEIYANADPDTGAYKNGDADALRADELLGKLHDAIGRSQEQHTKLDADAKYLRTNLEQLKTNQAELDEQIVNTEDMDMAEAITEMSWAQYCYNAALRIGTNILSQSLIDYMS